MPKYTFTRLSIVEEEFVVTADTEVAALRMVRDGAAGVEIIQGQWLDWADGSDYELRDVEDELATWIKEGAKKPAIV